MNCTTSTKLIVETKNNADINFFVINYLKIYYKEVNPIALPINVVVVDLSTNTSTKSPGL